MEKKCRERVPRSYKTIERNLIWLTPRNNFFLPRKDTGKNNIIAQELL